MSYSTSIPLALGLTGLTMQVSLVDTAGTLHASLRNLATTEIGTSGTYAFTSASMPDGYRGQALFHTGDLTTLADLTTANNYGIAGINPEEIENTDAKTSLVAPLIADWADGGRLDLILDALTVSVATANVSMVKVQAATYDTVTVSGNVLTLSNAATQTITAGGRATA